MRKKEINRNDCLMQGFRAGQHTCFEEVFNLLYASLCHYSLKITHDQAATEDIVEDSFIKIWERRAIFFELNVLKSYSYKTVRNVSLNWVKKTAITHPLPENIVGETIPEEYDSFNFIIESEVYSKLSFAIEKLSPQGKQIIKMIFFDGKDTRAVAEQLGVSQSTVKTQKGRSLIKLKKYLTSFLLLSVF